MKILLTAFVITLSCLFPALANAEEGIADNSSKAKTLEERINKAQTERRQKISDFIENKLIFMEISDDYRNLDDATKVLFFETLLKKIESRLINARNTSEKEILEIFSEKVRERLDNLYGQEIENEEVILDLIEIK